MTAFTYIDLEEPEGRTATRWVQPPQITYLVTTIDGKGNINSTPVTMGTCVGPTRNYAFALSQLPGLGPKQARDNLAENPECVISYVGYDLLRESWIAGMPIPRGISELDVAGLTPLPSRKVKPCGIQECAVNLEAKVVATVEMPPHHILYVCSVVGVQVNAEYAAQDREVWNGMGVLAIDPVFEVLIGPGETGNCRLYYARMDMDSIERAPEDIGCQGNFWIGTFERWIAGEQERGKVSEGERREIMELRQAWEADPDPVAHAEVKARLTAWLKKIVAKPPAAAA